MASEPVPLAKNNEIAVRFQFFWPFREKNFFDFRPANPGQISAFTQ